MAPTGPTIALVIVLPEGEGAVESLMPRLRDLRPSPREIIAVGGAQQAELPGRMPAGKRLRIVAGEPSPGGSGREGGLSQAAAWNRGCAEASSALVVFLAYDGVPAAGDWLERLVSPFDDLQVAATYGRQEPLQHDPVAAFRMADRFGSSAARHRARLNDPPSGGAPGFSLGNAAIRRSVWRGIHFNEHFPTGADREWGRQVLLASYTIAYVPEALVRRAVKPSVGEVAREALLRGWNDARLGSGQDAHMGELSSFAHRAAWHLLKTGSGRLLPRLYGEALAQAGAYRLGRRLHQLAPSLRNRIAPEIAHEEPRRELSDWERAA
jgi:hypothetical protein